MYLERVLVIDGQFKRASTKLANLLEAAGKKLVELKSKPVREGRLIPNDAGVLKSLIVELVQAQGLKPEEETVKGLIDKTVKDLIEDFAKEALETTNEISIDEFAKEINSILKLEDVDGIKKALDDILIPRIAIKGIIPQGVAKFDDLEEIAEVFNQKIQPERFHI